MKILVIDDEAASRTTIASALNDPQYRLEQADGAESALKKLREFHPDVIISDVHLPGLAAPELIRRLEQSPLPPAVILLTTSNRDPVAAEALRLGAHNYVPKPFTDEELRAVVRTAVEHQRLQKECETNSVELESALARLKKSQTALVQAEKMGSLGRLVAGIAHEINTPLGVIRANLDTTERAVNRIVDWSERQPAGVGADVRRMVDVLSETLAQSQAACNRINDLVTNFREFAQLDRAEFQRATVEDSIESVLAILGHEFGARTRVEKDFRAHIEVDCSPRQLNQMFMNLLLNANEAIQRAGRPGLIRIGTRAGDEWIHIEIEDNGSGIPPEYRNQIFDPGFTTKGANVGTGLGLPIVYQIVKTHQGRITVESREGDGTRFVIALPVNHYL